MELQGKKKGLKVTPRDHSKPKTKPEAEELEDDEEDEDDELFSDVPERGKGNNNILFIVAGAVVVVIAIILTLVFVVGSKEEPETLPPASSTQTQQEQPEQPEQQPRPETPSLGTQDFTQDTNMVSDSALSNPDDFITDLFGLTTRVDYTVKSIRTVSDFVSYTKYRGTWGGGMELYWLDAEYKGRKYVVQVPFQYYKELDDVGIVPVKMEVLTIEGASVDENLTVVSYMELDSAVLKDILKQQQSK